MKEMDLNDWIIAKAVSKSFKTKFGVHRVIGNISIELRRGQIVGFMGPSGCGKTTFFRLLSGLDTPDSGKMFIFGQTPVDARRRRVFAHVFQSPALLPWASVEENVGLPARIVGGRWRSTEETLGMTGLLGFERHYPHQLSGGMKQRVALARAISLYPEVILLDEPLNSLDERSREELQDLLLRISSSEKHLMILMITHDIREAAYLADRLIIFSPPPAVVMSELEINYTQQRGDMLRDSIALVETSQRIRQCFARPS